LKVRKRGLLDWGRKSRIRLRQAIGYYSLQIRRIRKEV